MQEANEMREMIIKDFAENYMEKLFYFCLKKTGNNEEAEDLTVLPQIVQTAQKKSPKVENIEN